MTELTSILWMVPMAKFQTFDKGEEIASWVPSYWELKVGDIIEYEIGQFMGRAQVVKVGTDFKPIADPHSDEEDKEVLGVECSFIKIY